jgi:uncharacterized protein YxjI
MYATSIFPQFFAGNDYFIDEKVNFFRFENAYKVYDAEGIQIGVIAQKLSAGAKMLRLLLNNAKAMMPFALEIRDMQDEKLVTIRRGWTFWTSKIALEDANGIVIGRIKQKFRLFRPTFNIFDADGQQIGSITGDWKAWNFGITDNEGASIGKITKKWAGAMKEIFTSADKYNVSIAPEVAEDTRKIAIVATAITIDMVLKESK